MLNLKKIWKINKIGKIQFGIRAAGKEKYNEEIPKYEDREVLPPEVFYKVCVLCFSNFRNAMMKEDSMTPI